MNFGPYGFHQVQKSQVLFVLTTSGGDHKGVSKNRGILPPKMDGENKGKPY